MACITLDGEPVSAWICALLYGLLSWIIETLGFMFHRKYTTFPRCC